MKPKRDASNVSDDSDKGDPKNDSSTCIPRNGDQTQVDKPPECGMVVACYGPQYEEEEPQIAHNWR